MIKEIIKDESILTQQSEKAEIEEAQEIITDLLDTANHHIDNCAGLAAPQIGVLKKVIVVRNGNTFFPMVNPVIVPTAVKKVAIKKANNEVLEEDRASDVQIKNIIIINLSEL